MSKSRLELCAVVVLGLLSSQLVGCSEGTSSNLFGPKSNSSLSSQSILDTSSTGFLQAKNRPPRMECTQDNIQIGGICDDSGGQDNYVEYSLTNQAGQPVPWTSGSQTVSVLQEGRCENGRYFLIVPRPPASLITAAQRPSRCIALGCWEEYRVNSRLFVRKKGLQQFEMVQVAPAIPIRIQLIVDGACPGN